MRVTSLAVMASLLAGCATGGVGPGHVDALWKWRDRDVALAPGGRSEAADAALRGVASGLARGGIAPAAAGAPGALTVEARALDESDGVRFGKGTEEVARLVAGSYGGVVGILGAGERAWNARQVRIELVLRAPDARQPVGAVVWEGWRGDDAAATAQRAGEEAGEALAREIARERRRWVTRRIADERMILTPTPLVLAPGEVVVSNDAVLLFHLGVGVSRRLQLDLALGGFPLPAAGGIAYAGHGGVAGAGAAGVAVVGLVAPGMKLRLVDEGPWWPGFSAGYDLVDVWGGALGAGGVGILGNGVAGAGGAVAAGVNIQLNLFTFAAAKHFTDWFQVGTGAYVVDNHHFLPQKAGFAAAGATTTGSTGAATGSATVSRLPTRTIPYLNTEMAAGRYVRFMSEYVFAPDHGYLTLAMRTLIPFGRRMGTLRVGGWWMKLDTGVVFTGSESRTGHSRTATLPWLGVGIYVP